MSPTLLKTLSLLALAACAYAQLSPNFYANTCPNALFTIKFAIMQAVVSEPRMGASLLRLHFHDCFVTGCDGSVLLDDTPALKGEKTALPNINSLRGFDVIDSIKDSLESMCPGVVSCADILAVAARDSVVTLGGPSWDVGLGRRDSTTANFNAVSQNLVTPFADLPELISKFAAKGFSARELVALYGAHTFGQAKCATFRNRIYNEPNIDPTFADSLKGRCPSSGGDGNLVPLDGLSPVIFDTAWFLGLIGNRGLLHADQQLYSGGVTDQYVNEYSLNILSFRNDFAGGMMKMSNLSPLTGASGQIRANCRFVN